MPIEASPAEGQRVLLGPGVISRLPDALGTAGARRALLVLSSSSAGRPWRERLLERMDVLTVGQWQHPSESPTEASVAAVADRAEADRADLIVAVGGGGVLDAAKAAVARLATAGARPPELVAVPTTPGSGAEATPFAAIWDLVAGRKTSVVGIAPPALAVVDPTLSLGLPAPVLAASVLDTLTQGVESAWSVRATSESLAAALTAVALVAAGGERLFDPTDLGALTVACLAGHWAGRAIAVSQTTACHAISYPLTGHYGLAHGHACVLSLPALLAFNATIGDDDCLDPRGAEHVRGVIDRVVDAFGGDTVSAVCNRVEAMRERACLASYAECGADSELVAHDAVAYGRLSNNPRLLDEGGVLNLLRHLEQQR
jgi:alcohol dehydrogenase class IV